MKVTRSPPCIVKRELFIFPILFYCDTSPPYLSSQHLSKGDKAWISSGFLYVNSSCVFAKIIIKRGLSLDPISIQDSRSAHLLAVFFIFIMFIFLCVLKKKHFTIICFLTFLVYLLGMQGISRCFHKVHFLTV